MVDSNPLPTGRLIGGARGRAPLYSPSRGNPGATGHPQGLADAVMGPVTVTNATGSPQRGHAGSDDPSSVAVGSLSIATTAASSH